MIYVLLAYAGIVTVLAKYFYDQWKETESLFELSKGFSPDAWFNDGSEPKYVRRTVRFTPKPLVKLNKDGSIMLEDYGIKPKVVRFNKDGSIAKKRGRPVGSEKK